MNTSLDDQGDYTCQIATSKGFRDSVTTLTVYAVPRFLQISNSSHQHADLFTPFEMRSDEPHTIVCSSFPPSSPVTNLSWELDPILKIPRNMIHYPSPTVISSRSSSLSSSRDWEFFATERRLILTPRDEDHGAVIHCFGDHPGLSERLSVSISLSVLVCPHRVSISCEPVVAGRPSMITCESALGNPASRLFWTVDGQEVEFGDVDHVESFNSSNTTEGFIASSVYSGSFDADDDGKIIRCCAHRNANVGCTTDICTECPLNVISKPKLLQGRNGLIMSMHEYYITLRCSARGNPSPLIQWYSPWMVHDSPINASTPGVISLVDTIIDGEGSDSVTIQSTLVIESLAGIDTRVQGVKCMASNSIGYSSTTSFFGNTSDISSEYNHETGLLTVRYSPGSIPLSADAIPCIHVDYKLASKQAWKRGTTCFTLHTNETVVQVQTGLNPTEIGLRVCYYKEFCDNLLQPQPSFQTSPRALNNILFPTLVVGIALGVILCTTGALFVYQKRGRKVHEQNRHAQGEFRRSQVSFRRTDQRPHARVEGAVSPSSPLHRGEMNYYMDMTSGTSPGATTGTTLQSVMMSPFQGSCDFLAYEDMRVDEQASSAGFAHYTAGCQSVDSMVYANMATSTPLKRSDSGICCTYSISPPQSDSLQNTYESSIFTIPAKLQIPTRDTDHTDVYMPMTQEECFVTSSPSSNTVASEWNFFPMSLTPREGQSVSREGGGMPIPTSVPYEVE